MNDRFRELLESPLDQKAAPLRWRQHLPLVVAAAAVGAVLAVGLSLLLGVSDDEPEVVVASTVPPSTTTTTSPPALPAGFTPATDRFGVRPDLMLVRGDRVYVSVTAAVTAGADPATVAQMETGLWFLGTGSDRAEFVTEHIDPLISGRITIEFPPGSGGEEVAVMEVIPGTRAEVEREVGLDIDAMPFAGPLEDDRVPLARGVELVIDDVAFNEVSGAIEWHLAGGTTERARVGAQLDLLDGNTVLGTIFSRFLLGNVAFLRAAEPPPGPTRSGITELGLPFGTSIDPDRVTGAVLRWTVQVFHYEEEALLVPLDGITRIEVG